jgi:aconitate hydratase
MTVAAALKGRKIAPHVSFGVSCGSRQVLEMVSQNGALADILAAGARLLESACGFCIGNSMAPKTDAVSVRTSNRNFLGRSGTVSANVYLCSPESAVAAALAGELVDPRDYFGPQSAPRIEQPDQFVIDDSMILPPSETPSTIEIVRGPNIGDPPASEPCPESIDGVGTIKVEDKITTDHIMPAGNRLKYRSNIPRYADFVFERTDPSFAANALENKERGIHNIIVAGESYGQGSSREHAAICPMFLGVRIVIAKSIERIHRANLINFGIIPAIFANPADYERIEQGQHIQIKSVREAVRTNSPLMAIAGADTDAIELRVDISERERRILLAGGMINATKDQ